MYRFRLEQTISVQIFSKAKVWMENHLKNVHTKYLNKVSSKLYWQVLADILKIKRCEKQQMKLSIENDNVGSK
jgi:hypothetical protein